LTGWAYVIGGENDEGKMQLYSLPTTWVRPNRSFSKFRIVNPNNPVGDSNKMPPLDRSQVGFACMPNPANPRSALAPASAQSRSVRIDDHIQTSQEVFFENGVFPSVVITLGRDANGNRPMLTASQHRQLSAIVRRKWTGVVRSGEPAIIDAMIERIDPLSVNSREMGWDRSGIQVRTRILSALGVHPFILGEPVSVGGYAQATVIEQRFCKRVNVFLDMLGNVVTNLLGNALTDERLLVWWESCSAVDESIRSGEWKFAVTNGAMSKNEYRTEVLGLPLMEEDTDRSPLLDLVGTLTATNQLLTSVGQGLIPRESVVKLLAFFFQQPEDKMADMLGVGSGSVAEAVESLETAVAVLRKSLSPAELTNDIEERLCCDH